MLTVELTYLGNPEFLFTIQDKLAPKYRMLESNGGLVLGDNDTPIGRECILSIDTDDHEGLAVSMRDILASSCSQYRIRKVTMDIKACGTVLDHFTSERAVSPVYVPHVTAGPVIDDGAAVPLTSVPHAFRWWLNSITYRGPIFRYHVEGQAKAWYVVDIPFTTCTYHIQFVEEYLLAAVQVLEDDCKHDVYRRTRVRGYRPFQEMMSAIIQAEAESAMELRSPSVTPSVAG